MIDRLFCLLLGHTWLPALGKWVWRCPHCTGRVTDIEILHATGVVGLPPKRLWRTH